jgi:hypothetical protein
MNYPRNPSKGANAEEAQEAMKHVAQVWPLIESGRASRDTITFARTVARDVIELEQMMSPMGGFFDKEDLWLAERVLEETRG